MIPTITATRYVTPLREGGSLPAIVETEDGSSWVLKFVGAGQGRRALVAELLAGELARALGLPMPELALIDLDPTLGRSEPDQEIQDLLHSSAGLNLGLRYLPGAFAFNPLLAPPPDGGLAADIVWFDAFVTNVDRTARNVNLLIWQHALWLIDHGACLYFHHTWDQWRKQSRTPFALIRQHVLLPLAGSLRDADARLRPRLTPALFGDIAGLIPEQWLGDVPEFVDAQAHRDAYSEYFTRRLESASVFVEEAEGARAEFV